MFGNNKILLKIKDLVKSSDPDAIVILYGSFARGEQHKSSDIDLLILLNKEKISYIDEKNIKYPLYDLEFDTGQIISPLVLTKTEWESIHRITPFYENIKNEGIIL